ncbi:phosphatidylethanolamine-binding protein [Schizophyllum amplum]|uniref:Phosphatidylethanolamine-binding protein n=1 Tax=Schizophyllum amplum TaxID=97359 RepID=A0A550D005_9AGAR|nr:phosphatidylethanolamine-binding protein [Auriculariopsis ampla]
MRLTTVFASSCLLAISGARGVQHRAEFQPPNAGLVTRASTAGTAATDWVRAAFYAAKIVPDILPSFEPTRMLKVNFTNPELDYPTVIIEPGVLLTHNQTKYMPQFSISNFTESDAEQTYVIIQIDPDAPTPQDPWASQIRHYMGTNYTADVEVESDLLLKNISVPIGDWVRPNPPAGSDPHRYIVLLYPQPENFTAESVAPFYNSSSSILNFNLTEFTEATGLGMPVAGTYFLTAPDA